MSNTLYLVILNLLAKVRQVQQTYGKQQGRS